MDDRTSLGEKTLSATRTVKEVIQQYGSTRNIPMSTSLFAAYRGAHKVYKEEFEKEKAANEKSASTVLGKRKMTNDDATSVNEVQARQKACEAKQKQAEKLINEGTQRLAIAVQSGKTDDILPSQALLESGNKILKECRNEMELLSNLLNPGQHLPSKSARQ